MSQNDFLNVLSDTLPWEKNYVSQDDGIKIEETKTFSIWDLKLKFKYYKKLLKNSITAKYKTSLSFISEIIFYIFLSSMSSDFSEAGKHCMP